MTNEQNDDFDIFLRKKLQQSKPYIDDGNFTTQIIEKVSAHKKLTRRQKHLIVLVPFLLITVFVLSQFPVFAFIMKAWVLLMLLGWVGWMQVSLVVFAVCIGTCIYWLLCVEDVI